MKRVQQQLCLMCVYVCMLYVYSYTFVCKGVCFCKFTQSIPTQISSLLPMFNLHFVKHKCDTLC